MSRETILSSLIRFDAPVEQLETTLRSLDWDAAPSVTLKRGDIVAVLERFAAAEIDASTVEDWANMIEGREDIAFEPGYERAISATIHDLANPLLSGPLPILAPALLAALR